MHPSKSTEKKRNKNTHHTHFLPFFSPTPNLNLLHIYQDQHKFPHHELLCFHLGVPCVLETAGPASRSRAPHGALRRRGAARVLLRAVDAARMESGTGGAGGGSDLPVPSVRGEALRKKPERKLDLKLGYYFFGFGGRKAS